MGKKRDFDRENRLSELGHAIWDRVMVIESLHLAGRHGSPNLSASSKKLIAREETLLWGDLQTLFRGGVFPDELAAQIAEMEAKNG